MPVRVIARIAAAGIVGIALLQVALALGVPWGEIAWGGRHQGVLPGHLRLASAVSAVVLAGAAVLVILAARPLDDDRRTVTLARRAAGLLAFLLLLSAFGNLMSASGLEQAVMTPVSLALGILTALVAWGPRASRASRTQRGRPKPPPSKRRR